MKFTPTGMAYDVCPICGQMIMPKEFGGKKHIQGHKVSEADKYFKQGLSIAEINRRLMSEGITLFPNIPHPMRNVTKGTPLSYGDRPCVMTGFTEYDSIVIKYDEGGRLDRVRLWDGRLKVSA